MQDPRGLRRGEASEQHREALEKLQRMSKLYSRVFGTPEGKLVLADLEETYQRRPILAETGEAMIYKGAQHDVILSVQEKVRMGNREEVTDE